MFALIRSARKYRASWNRERLVRAGCGWINRVGCGWRNQRREQYERANWWRRPPRARSAGL